MKTPHVKYTLPTTFDDTISIPDDYNKNVGRKTVWNTRSHWTLTIEKKKMQWQSFHNDRYNCNTTLHTVLTNVSHCYPLVIQSLEYDCQLHESTYLLQWPWLPQLLYKRQIWLSHCRDWTGLSDHWCLLLLVVLPCFTHTGHKPIMIPLSNRLLVPHSYWFCLQHYDFLPYGKAHLPPPSFCTAVQNLVPFLRQL